MTRQANHARRSRRRLLKRAGLWAAGLLAGGGLLDSLFIEPRWIALSRPSLRIAGLGEAWEGLRIALLADLHVGKLCPLDYIRRIVATTNAASPDVIVLVGDAINQTDAATDELAGVLADLAAPEGKFAVLGNHEYWTDPQLACRLLRAGGFDVLVNGSRVLHREGQPLCIAGVDDLRCGRPNLAAALDGVDADVPRILLCHNPDFAEEVPAGLRVDLMLCGHTHGGQIRLPLFRRAPIVPIRHRKYTEGLVRGPHCDVYVSRGLGMVALPLRFNCRPELPVVTLGRA